MIKIPYGKTYIEGDVPKERLLGVAESRLGDYIPEGTPAELIEAALRCPIGTPPLRELAKGKKNAVIIASDHTRPVPSRDIIPPMLREIRLGNPEARITILIATGCHRGTTEAELREKFGDEIFEREHIVVHDCDGTANLVSIGTLPSGGDLVINKIAAEADLLVSEGFIEPHFFAGFSGGRKSVLPGIASRSAVMYNHNSRFIADENARAGVLEHNPIHGDMVYAARQAGLSFIVNVVLGPEKNTVFAVAGDPIRAHLAGCDFLGGLCRVSVPPADIAVTSNGGYPLDQNIYQSVKGMCTAASAVKDGGVIIMASRCSDGHGGQSFYDTFRGADDVGALLDKFLATPPEETAVDQWQSQIFANILKRITVIFISDVPDSTVRELHMIPAHSFDEALQEADRILFARGIKNGGILVIPDGVSVIVE